VATGVSFTDANARFMAYDVLTFLSGIAAALLVAAAFTRWIWPLALVVSDKGGRKQLCQCARPPIAASQDFSAARDADQNRLNSRRHGLAQNLRGLVLQVGAIDELLFNALF
jgi:hypothetical protein